MAADNEPLIRFVREGLGCVCPDEVFERIEIESAAGVDADLPYRHQIIIGERLLLYIVDVVEPEASTARLADWLGRAQRECDRRGLNRVRLVLTTDDLTRLKAIVERLMESTIGRDEKTHVHVLHRDEIPVLDDAANRRGA